MTGNTRTPLLSVENLSVSFGPADRPSVAVQDLSFDLFAGETLAIVGESGSGKSVTALSILRLIEREGGRLDKGRIAFRLDDASVVDLAASSEAQLQRIRGNSISMIFQEPMTSLNPVLTIGDQICETLIHHKRLSPSQALREARDLLDRVRLSDPGRRLQQYPHELSGGMRQRVMIAMALACSPRVLIADEPTTALDVTIQAGILDLVRELQQTCGTAVAFITHDMGVVAEIADRVVVMRHGRMIETAETGALFRQPRADYTRQLLNAVPKLGSGAPVYAAPRSGAGEEGRGNDASRVEATVLEVNNLVTRFPIHKGMLKRLVARVHAVEDVSFTLRAGETLGLVGESGSGKSTIGRSVLKLVEPHSGRILFAGRDLMPLTRRHMRPMRRDLQMIFQDPYASLNPRMSVAELVTEPLIIHTALNTRERRDMAVELLARVRLPADSIDRYPHQFSGGQRQRICIARALSSKPRIIVADEAVSALDVSVQAEVIDLMQELQRQDGIAYLFISHDIAVIEKMSHRVAVLDQGRIVEIGGTDDVLQRPRHDYTRQLLDAVPVADPNRRRARASAAQIERKTPIRPVGYRPAASEYLSVGEDHLVLVQ